VATEPKPVLIVGCGPGAPEYVTPAARQAARQAGALLGAGRLLELFPECACEKVPWRGTTEAMLDEIGRLLAQGKRVAVLVSGDPGLFSLAQSVLRRFGAAACEIIPAVSPVQVAFARVGLDWAGVRILSAHGRSPGIDPMELAETDKVAILAGTAEALAWCARAATALEETHTAVVCENLTLPGERVRILVPQEIATCGASSLTIVLLVRRALTREGEAPAEPLRENRNGSAGASPSLGLGTLYGMGVGPGDPEWMTVKAARILAGCRHVCVPRSRDAADSVALEIARPYLRPDAVIHETTFLMTSDRDLLRQSHRQAAQEVLAVLASGEDCCFLTLGDAMLYSTYIYLLRELRDLCPAVKVETVPGITAFSAAAALTGFPVGEGKQTVTIVPASDDLGVLRRALDGGGTVVLMKVGSLLEKVLDELEARGLTDHAVFVSHAGMASQRVETDLRSLRGAPSQTGYLSILIIQAGPSSSDVERP